MEYAPDLILGYNRGFRSSWKTGLGSMTNKVLLDNDDRQKKYFDNEVYDVWIMVVFFSLGLASDLLKVSKYR